MPGALIRSLEDPMEPSAILPVLVSAVIVVLVASGAAILALWWEKRPAFRQVISRVWIVVTALSALAVLVFWISTAMTGSKSPTVDRSLQQKQNAELRHRLQGGGH